MVEHIDTIAWPIKLQNKMSDKMISSNTWEQLTLTSESKKNNNTISSYPEIITQLPTEQKHPKDINSTCLMTLTDIQCMARMKNLLCFKNKVFMTAIL